MSRRARTILIESMRRFHDREQVILRIVETAKSNGQSGFVIYLTPEDLDVLRSKAS